MSRSNRYTQLKGVKCRKDDVVSIESERRLLRSVVKNDDGKGRRERNTATGGKANEYQPRTSKRREMKECSRLAAMKPQIGPTADICLLVAGSCQLRTGRLATNSRMKQGRQGDAFRDLGWTSQLRGEIDRA